MKIYILDAPSKSREQMILWLEEEQECNQIEVFTDSVCCLKKVEESLPDVCIIRLGLASIPGISTAAMIKAIDPGIKIVLIAEETDYVLDAFELGAYGYILCPVEKKKLESILAKVSISE